jgi:predicted RNA-binding protein with PUA-like domain
MTTPLQRTGITGLWLMKSEPDAFSIDDLRRKRRSGWDGVRNYTARNFMRDEMRVGDLALFHHSNASPSGVVGLMQVSKTGLVDPTQFDPDSGYYDAKATPSSPRWFMVEVTFREAFERGIPLDAMRADPELAELLVLAPGQRLSIVPVAVADFARLLVLAGSRAPISLAGFSRRDPIPLTRARGATPSPSAPPRHEALAAAPPRKPPSRRAESASAPGVVGVTAAPPTTPSGGNHGKARRGGGR